MGHNGKNPDRWTSSEWRACAETVGQMATQGWIVKSHCPACDLRMQVALKAIAATQGANFSLWGQQLACRREGCSGKVRLEAKPPGVGAAIYLDAPQADVAVPKRRAPCRTSG